MKFAVRKITVHNQVVNEVLDALDMSDAQRTIQSRGEHLVRIEAQAGLTQNMPSWLGGGAEKFELTVFSQELLTLLQAGLGLVESIEALNEKEKQPGRQLVFAKILDGLRAGKRFSVVLAEQERVFPPLFLGILRAAEGTGDVPQALSRYIRYQKRTEAVSAKVLSAAIYPAILLLVGGAVSIFLIGYVVPSFAEVYQGSARTMPWMSALLFALGQWVGEHIQWLALAGVVLLLLAVVAWQGIRQRGGIIYLLRKIPNIGARVQIYELSKLYLTLGMLLEGGISLSKALDTATGVVSRPVADGVKQAQQFIQSGMPFSTAFESVELTTPISMRMLLVGERSGNLGPMLSQAAAFYDDEISLWVDRFMRSFEPLLMAAIGLVVGVIVVLLYMPIIDLAGNF